MNLKKRLQIAFVSVVMIAAALWFGVALAEPGVDFPVAFLIVGICGLFLAFRKESGDGEESDV
jgi:hypothetical protein